MSVWPRRMACSLPVATCHSLIVWSRLAEASVLPSRLKATEVTWLLCPLRVACSLPVATSQSLSSPGWNPGPAARGKDFSVSAPCQRVYRSVVSCQGANLVTVSVVVEAPGCVAQVHGKQLRIIEQQPSPIGVVLDDLIDAQQGRGHQVLFRPVLLPQRLVLFIVRALALVIRLGLLVLGLQQGLVGLGLLVVRPAPVPELPSGPRPALVPWMLAPGTGRPSCR